MGTAGLRKCCHCGSWFKPHPRNVHHQRYCALAPCCVASKRASQRRWMRKNRRYFRGEDEVRRVQAWRQSHPGYWRRNQTRAAIQPELALQEVLATQPFGAQYVDDIRNGLLEEISRPLQDLLTAQGQALVGLACLMSGDTLPEDIARVLSACYERGQRIGGVVPWMPRQEVQHARTRTDCAAAAATHSETV